MLPRLLLAALLGALICTGAAIAGRFLGPDVLEANTREFNEGAHDAATLETLEYQQGYLTSRAVSRLTNRSPAQTFLIEHRIEHKPWTPFQRAAFVHVTSWMWRETGGSQDETPIAEVKTRIVAPFLVYATFKAPSNPLQGSTNTRWTELTGSVQQEWNKVSSEVHVEGLELSRGGKLRIARAQLGMDGESRGGEFKVQGFSSRAEDIALQTALGKSEQLERFELRMAERADGELLGYDVRFDMQGLKSSDGHVEQIVVDVALEHISPEVRGAFDQGPRPPDPAALLPLVAEAARHSPKLVVRELRMKGRMDIPIDLAVSGSVRIDGERFSMANANLQALPECVDADLELRLAEEFLVATLRKPFAGRASQAVDAQHMTDGILQAGYFERDGAYLQSRFRMRGVKSVLLNGQPLDQAIARFASFTQQASARMTASTPAAPDDPEELTNPWQPSHPSNPELDEMRRQMGLQ